MFCKETLLLLVLSLHALRRTDISNPTTPPFLHSIQYLSKSDVSGRDRFGPFATVSRRVRGHINHQKLRDFARVLDLPLFKWQLTCWHEQTSRFSSSSFAGRSFRNPVGIFGYFVKGAPVLLTQNIQATRHLVNRTRAIMHSLMLRDAHEPPL